VDDGLPLSPAEAAAGREPSGVIRRDWMDWSSPCLPEAAARLRRRGGAETGPCDLRRVLCVTPGRRDGRLLLHLLAAQCHERGRALVPPAIVTPGDMVDRLLGLPAGDASAPELILAWMAALDESGPAALKPLFPAMPAAPDLLGRRDIAATIARLRDELAGARLDFVAVRRNLDARHAPAFETARWSALATLQERYLATLTAAGHDDPHDRRRDALAGDSGAADIDEVVLVATRQLNQLQRDVLDAFRGPITALVHAPEHLASRFDEHGCLVTDAWLDATIDVDDQRIEVCDQPADQAQAALRTIASFDGRYAAAQITVGLGDEGLSSQLERDADAIDLPVHAAWGREMSRTPPSRLLEAIADWLEDARFAAFSSLLRHADLERWLAGRDVLPGLAPWLTLIDRYFTEHLHERLSGAWLGDPDECRRLEAVHGAVQALLRPLQGPPRPLGDWAEPVLDILREVYGDLAPAPGRPSIALEACLGLRSVLASLAGLPGTLQPTVAAPDALRLILAGASSLPVAIEASAEQVEMLGWLELHLDPAPALIITGVNDGKIPASVAGDPFLPDSLRRDLGLACNDQRAARDAYMLLAILHSREHVTLITGRRSQDHDPLPPSRLLLASDGHTIARRLRQFCGDGSERAAELPAGLPAPGASPRFDIPTLPEDLPAPAVMSVTDFGRYLHCPYRFALEKLLKLKTLGDGEVELDPLRFGSLAHDVLDDFGQDEEIRDATDSRRIGSFLLDMLDQRVRRSYGEDPLPSVRIQVDHLRRRLRAFAAFQAQRRTDGWIIAESERRYEDDYRLDVPGQPDMPIKGRIDRIDRHEKTNRVCIIDYKTSGQGHSPHYTHHGRETLPDDPADLAWQDLQLPLYWYLWRQDVADDDVELAYLVLPRRVEEIRVRPGAWSEAQLQAGVEKARWVVQRIRAGDFEINRDASGPSDPFARICQTTVFRAVEDDAEVEP
jgi:hypothetical protein